jgi:hypothetical protein
MDQAEKAPSEAQALARADKGAGQAALQVVEVILLALVERGVVDKDDVVAQIESLASAATSEASDPPPMTLKGHLTQLALSLSALSSGGRD